MAPNGQRLAVLGSPIAHSRSPQLHSAAYEVLGLPWSYERCEVGEDGLGAFVESRDATWRGLSLTMPLKEAIRPLLAEVDDTARLTGAVNTVLLGERRRGWNTDVGGIVRAFAERGVDNLRTAVLLGTGATARSSLVALQRMGVERVTVSGRRERPAEATAEFARSLGLAAEQHPLGLRWRSWPDDADVVVSTLPGHVDFAAPPPANAGLALFDVAYGDAPSSLTTLWNRHGDKDRVVSGLDMLLHQALLQVRVFVHGEIDRELEHEEAVLRAMRAAVGGF